MHCHVFSAGDLKMKHGPLPRPVGKLHAIRSLEAWQPHAGVHTCLRFIRCFFICAAAMQHVRPVYTVKFVSPAFTCVTPIPPMFILSEKFCRKQLTTYLALRCREILFIKISTRTTYNQFYYHTFTFLKPFVCSFIFFTRARTILTRPTNECCREGAL